MKEEAVRAAFAASEELEVVEITYQGRMALCYCKKEIGVRDASFFW